MKSSSEMLYFCNKKTQNQKLSSFSDNCITGNKHVRKLKWSRSKNAPSGRTFTRLTDGVYNYRNQINKNYKCSRDSWFGFCNGKCIGSIKTKLKKCGKARLYYGNCGKGGGNCGKGGCVEAKLNGKIIGRASGYSRTNVVFDFKDGDTLELFEWGIIEFNDFKIISCSAC